MEEVVRMFLVLAHLGALMAAAAAVAFGDYALLGRHRIDSMLLGKASHAVAWALAGLWLSGLAIIGVDTGFAWAAILAKPKLMAKLTVVLLLTANGFYLHRVVLPSLLDPRRAARPLAHVAARAARAGAFSAAGWSVAVFLGVARPLAPLLGYAGFMALFALAVAAVVEVDDPAALLEPRSKVAPDVAVAADAVAQEHDRAARALIEAPRGARARLDLREAAREQGLLQRLRDLVGPRLGARALRVSVGAAVRAHEEVTASLRHRGIAAYRRGARASRAGARARLASGADRGHRRGAHQPGDDTCP